MQRHPWGSCLCGDVAQGAPCKGAVAELLACAAAREYDAGRCAAALAALRACVEREGVASLRVRSSQGPFLAGEGREGEGGDRVEEGGG